MENRLIIFLKAPRPGFVKTRLARQLGDRPATAVYCLIVERLLANLSQLKPVELRFTPDDARAEVECWQRPGWSASPQGTGELGVRLEAAFAESFRGGIDRVTVIGSDCPAITAGDIERSWRLLDENDLVLGPARDGGYWLIALRNECRALFRNIEWSTGSVLNQTLANASAAGLKVQLLDVRVDIDRPEDWEAFQSQLPD